MLHILRRRICMCHTRIRPSLVWSRWGNTDIFFSRKRSYVLTKFAYKWFLEIVQFLLKTLNLQRVSLNSFLGHYLVDNGLIRILGSCLRDQTSLFYSHSVDKMLKGLKLSLKVIVPLLIFQLILLKKLFGTLDVLSWFLNRPLQIALDLIVNIFPELVHGALQ